MVSDSSDRAGSPHVIEAGTCGHTCVISARTQARAQPTESTSRPPVHRRLTWAYPGSEPVTVLVTEA